MSVIIEKNIDNIRKKVQVVFITFNGGGLSNQYMALDRLFFEITEDKNAINKINKKIKFFQDTPQIIKTFDRIKRHAYKFRDSNLAKTFDREYIILNKDKTSFQKELKNITETYSKDINNRVTKCIDSNKNKLITKLETICKELKLLEHKKNYKNIIENYVGNESQRLYKNIKISFKCRYYDISKELLEDREFCEKLSKYMFNKGEMDLYNLLLEINKLNAPKVLNL